VKKLFLILFALLSAHAANPYYMNKLSQFEMLEGQKMSIMMQGDSITDWGLWSELTGRSDIVNRGIAGDTTDGLLKRMDILNPGIRQVFIMIGINDILQGEEPEHIFDNYRKILAFYQKKGITPFIQSTLYVGKNSPPELNRKVTVLNRMLKEFARQQDMTFIDLTPILCPHGELESRFTYDGLHLNGEAYRLWADAIAKYFVPQAK